MLRLPFHPPFGLLCFMTKGVTAMEITEKVAYLKGLAEGMELDTGKKEGKLLSAIIDVLEDIALELQDIEDTVWMP